MLLHNFISPSCWRKTFSVSLTLMQAVSAARTPWITVWSRFCAFFTRISSDDLHPGVTALTLERHHAPLGSHEIFCTFNLLLMLFAHVWMCQWFKEESNFQMLQERPSVRIIASQGDILLIVAHLEMIVSWLEMVRICSAMTKSSSVQCLSRQWSAMTRTNWVIDWPLETRSFADVTKASLV